MAQTGYTPISLYYSSTASAAPTAGNLVDGELAINTADGKLFYKDSSGVVQTLATKNAAAGSFTSITDSGNLTFTGTANRITGDFSNATAANRVMVQTSTTNGVTGFALMPNGTASTSYLEIGNSSDPANSSTGYFAVNGANDVRISSGKTGTGSYVPLTIYTGGSERMRIDSSGNVGIGTASPTEKVTSSNGFLSTGAVSTTARDGAIVDYSGNIARFIAGRAGGNYGQWEAHVAGASGVTKRYQIDYDGTTYWYGANGTTERMRIDSSGNLLVGTASNLGNFTLKGSGSTAATNSIYNVNSSGTLLLSVRNDGYISTGSAAFSPYNNTTGSAANLLVDSAGGLYRSTSSLKYKKEVRDYDKGLDIVMNLRPVYYKGTSDRDGDTQFAGLIAEEVDAAGLTEFVQYAEDGSPDALAYGQMVSLLTKAIQEQQVMIEELKAKVAALEAA